MAPAGYFCAASCRGHGYLAIHGPGGLFLRGLLPRVYAGRAIHGPCRLFLGVRALQAESRAGHTRITIRVPDPVGAPGGDFVGRGLLTRGVPNDVDVVALRLTGGASPIDDELFIGGLHLCHADRMIFGDVLPLAEVGGQIVELEVNRLHAAVLSPLLG